MPPRKNAAAELRAENAALKAELAKAKAAVIVEDFPAPLIREAEKPKLTGTVTVACKIPGGLRLVLQDVMERVVDDPKKGKIVVRENVPQANDPGKVRYVFGPSVPAMGGVPDGYVLPPSLDGGYALTHGIPAAFWELWLEQNKLADYVVNGMIFAHDRDSTRDKARELNELKSGMEPLSREVDAQGRMLDRRMPKPASGSLARITPDYERESDPQRKAVRHPAE